MFRFGLTRLKALALSVPLALASASAFAAPTQLGFAIDGSGSINSTEFSTQRQGLANAFGALPTDSSVEITVVQFSSSQRLEVGPLLIDSVATRNSLVTQTNAIGQLGGGTDPELAIDRLTSEMTGSSNFGGDSIINLSTDGGFSLSPALTSANAAKAAGIDALTGEGIGSGANLNNLQSLVYGPNTNPNDGSGQILATDATPPNPLATGVNPWVVPVSDFNAFGPVIQSKIQAVVDVPAPATLILTLAGIAGLAATRIGRRRQSATALAAA